MNNKIATITEGIVAIVLGVLIAIFGGGEVLNIYVGVVCLIGGIACLLVAGYALVKKAPFPVGATIFGSVLLTLGIALLAGGISIAVAIDILVYALLGVGAGFVLCGIYALVNKALALGIGQIAIGAGLVVLSILYITVPDFRTAFWIIVGILVALYGALVVVSALLEKKK